MKWNRWNDWMVFLFIEFYLVEIIVYIVVVLEMSVLVVKYKVKELGLGKLVKFKWMECVDYICSYFNEEFFMEIGEKLGVI